MPDNNQLARIHILKKEAGLTEDQYRTLLGGYGVASSKEFNNIEARKFSHFLQRYIDNNSSKEKGHGWGKNKYEYLRGRQGDFAEPQQLRMIEAIWREVARNPGDDALQSFLQRQSGVKNITWLKKHHVEPVLVALKSMKQKQKDSKKKDKALL